MDVGTLTSHIPSRQTIACYIVHTLQHTSLFSHSAEFLTTTSHNSTTIRNCNLSERALYLSKDLIHF